MAERAVAWLVSNVRSDAHHELFESELASSRLRAGVCIQGCLSAGIPVLPLNLRDAKSQPGIVFMGKYVHDSGSGQFLDDSGRRWHDWLEKIHRVKSWGGRLVVDYTDNHLTASTPAGDFYRAIQSFVDVFVVPSEKMRSNLAGNANAEIVVIPEPVEIEMQAIRYRVDEPRVGLWFGHYSNLEYLAQFIKAGMLAAPPEKMIILTNHVSESLVKTFQSIAPKGLSISMASWSKEAMLKAARQAHFCVLPSSRVDPKKNGASPGRLLTALALGLPTLAEPLDSYLQFDRYFERIDAEQALDFLRAPERYTANLPEAQDMISRRFTIGAIGEQWALLANSILAR